jgi:hypothetical protein
VVPLRSFSPILFLTYLSLTHVLRPLLTTDGSTDEPVPNQLAIECLKFLNLKADVIDTAKTFSRRLGELENFLTKSLLSILKYRLLIALQY